MGFKKIESQSPRGKTMPLVLRGISGEHGSPILHLEHLGESNTAWWLENLARARAEVLEANAKPTPKKPVTAESMAAKVAELRAQKRETVIVHSARDVENLYHDDGTPATKADIADFIHALPDDVFDDVWKFAEDPDNYRETPIVGNASAIAGK